MTKERNNLIISERFSLIRNKFSLTAGRLGEIAGVSGTAIAKIESGETANPRADVLAKISTKLQIDLNWLILGEGEMLKTHNQASRIMPDIGAGVVSAKDNYVSSSLLGGHSKVIKQEMDFISMRLADARQLSTIQQTEYTRAKSIIESLQKRRLIGNISEDDEMLYQKQSERLSILEAHERLNRADIQSYNVRLVEKQKEYIDAIQSEAWSSQGYLSDIYRISGEPDRSRRYSGLLTHRLNITEEAARQLVSDGKIRSIEIAGEGYRVTELAVREFLGEA